VLQLVRTAPGNYAGSLPDFANSRWGMTLEDDGKAWRLTGNWNPGAGTSALGGNPSPR
jgi:hypothetical protein